jgi:hypothetical protein
MRQASPLFFRRRDLPHEGNYPGERRWQKPPELDDPSDNPPPVPPVSNGPRRPEVEAELAAWYAMGRADQVAALRATMASGRRFTVEALVHISCQAYAAGDRLGLPVRSNALSAISPFQSKPMALFIRCWVTVTSSMPDNLQELTQTKGRHRFSSFLQMLGQRLATAQRISNEVSADIRLDAPV